MKTKNKFRMKAVNIILALAILLGNAPEIWALRTANSLNAESDVDERISDELDDDPDRGADTGFITKREHKILREVIADLKARHPKYRRKDIEENLGITEEDIKIQVVPGFYEAAKARGVPVKGHYAIREKFIYIDKDTYDKYGKIYVEHELSELRDIRNLALVNTLAGTDFRTREDLMRWIDEEDDPIRLEKLWTDIHNRAPQLPDEEAEEEIIRDYRKKALYRYVVWIDGRVRKYNLLERYTQINPHLGAFAGAPMRVLYQAIGRELFSGRPQKNISSGSLFNILSHSLEVLKDDYPKTGAELRIRFVLDLIARTINLAKRFGVISAHDRKIALRTLRQIKYAKHLNRTNRYKDKLWEFSDLLQDWKRPARGTAGDTAGNAGAKEADFSLADATVDNSTNAGLAEFLEDTKNVQGALIIGAKAILENAGMFSALRQIKAVKPAYQIIVWAANDEDASELKARGITSIVEPKHFHIFEAGPALDTMYYYMDMLIDDLRKENGELPIVLANSYNEKEDYLRLGYGTNLKWWLSKGVKIFTLDDEPQSKFQINLPATLLASAIARLSPEELEMRLKKFIDQNRSHLESQQIYFSEDTYNALINVKENSIFIPFATTKNEQIIAAQEIYATQK